MAAPDKKQQLKDEKKDVAAEEQALDQAPASPRHSGAWEVDSEYRKAHAAVPAAEKAQAEATAEANEGATPEVPGEATYTHGGTGAPPTVDPSVQALIDSGKELEVGGDDKLREVSRPDKS